MQKEKKIVVDKYFPVQTLLNTHIFSPYMIRAPICTVVGHVDHGKTSLLDTIRGTAVTAGEAGKITQAIGASIIPIEHILERSASIIKKQHITIPGLLFIDTPGHAAFSGMRNRGGGLSDIAILLVDINEGCKPQTKEAIEILKKHKTPFIIAANKIDLITGYSQKNENIIQDIQLQNAKTQEIIETKTYELVAQVAEQGIQSDRFDRVEDFTKKIAIVPISARTKAGINSMLALIVGLAQKFLETQLHATAEGPAKGTILEVSEEQGLGTTLNVILQDGTVRVGDTLLIGTLQQEPIITKIRALLQPNSIADLRDKKARFKNVPEAIAATGVKIVAPGIENALAGMPIMTGQSEEAKKAVQERIAHVTIHTDKEGIIIKADNIGSLEALVQLFKEKNVPIRIADIGPITKKDLLMAASNPEEFATIYAFNLPRTKEPIPEGVQLFEKNIIYALIDDYEEQQRKREEKIREEKVTQLNLPARIRVLEGCIFRSSNPLVCGVEVLKGNLKKNTKLIKEQAIDQSVGYVKEIQEKNKNISLAKTQSQVAISIPGAIGGKHVLEGDILWSAISEEEFKQSKQYAKLLDQETKETLKEYAELMRRQQPLWGI